jgi:hypothetical protein
MTIGDSRHGPNSHLELREITSRPLSSELAIVGGVLTKNGSVILLTDDGVWLLRDWKAQPTRICQEMRLQPRHITRGPLEVQAQVFDSASQSVVQIDSSGHCVRQLHRFLRGNNSIPARLNTRWLEITLEPHSDPEVRIITANGTSVHRLERDSQIRFGDAQQYSVRADGVNSIILTESSYPYRVFRADKRQIKLVFDPSSQLSVSERASASAWNSLPAVRLDQAYLQILADRTSDRRYLLTFDLDGRLLRKTLVDVAIGVLDADAASKTLLALRNTGSPELVFYRWRWRANVANREAK